MDAENSAAEAQLGSAFDFSGHSAAAVAEYQRLKPTYAQAAALVEQLLRTCIEQEDIAVHSIGSRAKEIESFRKKAEKPSQQNPNRPKYERPLEQVTDLAGVRVITYFLSSLERIENIVRREFEVIEHTDKTKLLEEEERLGYHSVHFLVRLLETRTILPEYTRFGETTIEIQVRTILQHAWAEIEHDLQYKATDALPTQIRRRFMTLAGMLEIADREFQGIQDEDERLRAQARSSVAAGQLTDVEITPDALKAYLDRRLGPDGRMSRFSYKFTADLVTGLGFETLQSIEEALSGIDDDYISRILYGSRQGQLTRFEDALLVALGQHYINHHPWSSQGERWYAPTLQERMRRLTESGVSVGRYSIDNAEPVAGSDSDPQ